MGACPNLALVRAIQVAARTQGEGGLPRELRAVNDVTHSRGCAVHLLQVRREGSCIVQPLRESFRKRSCARFSHER